VTDNDPQKCSPEELAAIELGYALANLGPDTDRTLMVTLRLANGRFVKDVWLSANDVQTLIDGALAIGELHACAALAGPEPLPEVDGQTVTDVITGFEGLLSNTNREEAEGDQ
jgi:hypothetical protein